MKEIRSNRLTLIIGLMGLALLGLIGVQFYWIREADELNRQQFRHGVHAAMQMVVNKLQALEAAKMLEQKQWFSDTAKAKSAAAQPPLTAQAYDKEDNQAPANPPTEPPVVAEKKNAPKTDSFHTPAAQPQTQNRKNASPYRFTNGHSGYDIPISDLEMQALEFYAAQPFQNQTIINFYEFGSESRSVERPVSGKKNKKPKRKNGKVHFEITDSSIFSSYSNSRTGSYGQSIIFNGGILHPAMFQSLRQEILRTDLDSLCSFSFGCELHTFSGFEHNESRLQPQRYAQPAGGGALFAAYNPPNTNLDWNPNFSTEEPEPAFAQPDAAADAKCLPVAAGSQSKQKLLNKVNYLEQFMQRLLQQEADMRSRVDSAALHKMIADELKHYGIAQPFSYAIYAPHHKQTVYAHQISYEDAARSAYQVRLFPNDLLSSPHYLTLVFPAQNRFTEQVGVLSVAGTFILIIVFCFGYTVNTIFRQKKLSDMKTDFINNMTHEFKTPITTISLASEALKNDDDALNEKQRLRFANMIFDENKRLESQVERVLQMAKLERDEVKLKYTPVDVHELIENALQKVNLQVEKRNGVIARNLSAAQPRLTADAVHLTNMIYNLLDNAIKYSPDELHITIETENMAHGVAISIVDRGIGLSADAQRKIFEKFYRVPNAQKNRHDVKGFGLGLSYVKMMAEAHGGNVMVKSEPRKGSRFTLYLPFQPKTEDPA